jgi:phosphoribosyl 1,2-cyclic phosphate phosphodiesterase
MRLTFLGTGTSAGVPAIACSCAVCTSADPRDRRLRTAACLRFTDARGVERTILIDAGPDLRQQALAAGLTRCDAVVFTHNHVDHTFGVDELRRFNAVQREPIDIYAEPHTLGHLRRVYQHIFESDKNVNQSFVATLIAHTIDAEQPFDLFGAKFTPIRLLHGRLPVLGFRIDPPSPPPPASAPAASETRLSERSGGALPLAYCTDVSAIPPESYRHLRGLKTLVLDALRHRHHPTHLTLQQAVTIAGNVGAERTYFVHMAHDLGHEETQAQLPESMFLAYDGLTIGGG